MTINSFENLSVAHVPHVVNKRNFTDCFSMTKRKHHRLEYTVRASLQLLLFKAYQVLMVFELHENVQRILRSAVIWISNTSLVCCLRQFYKLMFTNISFEVNVMFFFFQTVCLPPLLWHLLWLSFCSSCPTLCGRRTGNTQRYLNIFSAYI